MSCNCGCDSCGNVGNIGVVLNESIVKRDILSENLRYHVQNQLPLTENTFRYGSDSFLNLWAEARALYLREIIHVNEDDIEILTETNIGNFGVLEDGTKVPLDLPMLDEATRQELGMTSSVSKSRAKAALKNPSNDESKVYGLDKDGKRVELKSINDIDKFKKFEIDADLNEAKKYKKGDKLKVKLKNGKEFDITFDSYSSNKGIVYGKIDGDRKPFSLDAVVSEAKAKNDNKKLNKPMRDSSGGKAYKVYVKDPKTGNIKTVRFGSGGLRAKINDKKARNAFAKRHKCSEKTDKTKASYWSCRLPRYAKLLGLKSTFTGFW